MDQMDGSVVSSPESSEDKNCEAEVKRTLRWTRLLLKCLGAWPMVTKDPSRASKYCSNTFILLWSLLLTYLVLPAALQVLQENDLSVRINLIGPVSFWLTNSFKYGLVIYHCGTIKICIEHMKSDWKNCDGEESREIMKRNEKVGRDLTFICGLFMYAGGLSYHALMPLLRGNFVTERNVTARSGVYPAIDIFAESPSRLAYESLFWTTRAFTIFAYNVPIVACNLAAVFVAHACGQLQIVISRLNRLVDAIDENIDCEKLIQQHISKIVQCHVRVIRFSSGVERVLQDICLIEVIASTLIICLLEFYCMTEWSNSETISIMTYFTLLISLSFNLFIFCHIGELFKEQCEKVGKAAYMIDWNRLPGKTGLALVMIIAMADHTRKLTAGGMIELTIYSFGLIIKTSLVYLNILRTVVE